ncbi:MAG: NMD3 family-domain-containing protein, partial [Olpidium bornovanus]
MSCGNLRSPSATRTTPVRKAGQCHPSASPANATAEHAAAASRQQETKEHRELSSTHNPGAADTSVPKRSRALKTPPPLLPPSAATEASKQQFQRRSAATAHADSNPPAQPRGFRAGDAGEKKKKKITHEKASGREALERGGNRRSRSSGSRNPRRMEHCGTSLAMEHHAQPAPRQHLMYVGLAPLFFFSARSAADNRGKRRRPRAGGMSSGRKKTTAKAGSRRTAGRSVGLPPVTVRHYVWTSQAGGADSVLSLSLLLGRRALRFTTVRRFTCSFLIGLLCSLCCQCGTSIVPNAANMCINCLRTTVDITEFIPKQVTLHFCRACERYLQPPGTWVSAQLESRELLALCLKKLKGLSKVRLIDAGFIWTEPHSRRVRVKLTIQKEVLTSTILQQIFQVEYVVSNQQCEDCARIM